MLANQISDLHSQGFGMTDIFILLFSFLCQIRQICFFFRAVLTVLGITLDAQNISQVQPSQANMVDSSNSEKEVAVPEKSKESSVAGWQIGINYFKSYPSPSSICVTEFSLTKKLGNSHTDKLFFSAEKGKHHRNEFACWKLQTSYQESITAVL